MRNLLSILGKVFLRRRLWAVTALTFREAMHNKVLLSCAFFTVVLVLIRLAVFAVGEPETLKNVEHFTHIALFFILMTGVVVTIVVVAPSLSQDIKTKVIYTVVPKPIHRAEILLGKVLGFAGTAGLILLINGLLTLGVLLLTVQGRSEDGRLYLAAEVRRPANSIRYTGGYVSYLKRSDRRWMNPHVGEKDLPPLEERKLTPMKFAPGEAIVTFNNVKPRDLGSGSLRFEIRVGVHRYGGGAGEDPELSVRLVNLDDGISRTQGRLGPDDEDHQPFNVREEFPRRITAPADFIGDGATVEVHIKHLTPKHRVGIRREDVTLLLADRSYAANFAKTMLILFMEMLLVVVVAVMSSTFLTGLIAILFTAVVWVGGHLLGWMAGMLTYWSRTNRGPLVEITHEFDSGEFVPRGPLDWVLGFTNSIFKGIMTVVARVFPNLGHFDSAWLVASNTDISGTAVWRAAQFSILYSVVCFVIAYVIFRFKEVAR